MAAHSHNDELYERISVGNVEACGTDDVKKVVLISLPSIVAVLGNKAAIDQTPEVYIACFLKSFGATRENMDKLICDTPAQNAPGFEPLMCQTSYDKPAAERQLLTIGFAVGMALVKGIDEINMPAVQKRLAAAAASIRKQHYFTGTLSPLILSVTGLKDAVKRITDLGAKDSCIQYMLTTKASPGTLVGALLDQIRLVAQYSGMTSIRTMNDFIEAKTGGLLIEQVLKEARLFSAVWEDLSQRLGVNLPNA